MLRASISFAILVALLLAWSGTAAADVGAAPALDGETLQALRDRAKIQRPTRAQRLRQPYRATLLAKTTLRPTPSDKAAALHTWAAGERLTVIAHAGSWSYVKRGFRRGWIPKARAERRDKR